LCYDKNSTLRDQQKSTNITLTKVEFMYFGSVRFFKHLIYTVFFIFLGTLVFLAVFFGILFFRERAETRELTERLSEAEGITEQLADMVAEQSGSDGTGGAGGAGDTGGAEPPEPITAPPATESVVTTTPTSEIPPETTAQTLADPEAPAYQKLYPELYTDPPAAFETVLDAAYLTFDDGPSEHTENILWILNKHEIKATFFFSGGESSEDKRIMKAAADAGHSIGVHSLSHDYPEVYESVESFLADFNATYVNVSEATGVKPQIFRFAGGSINNYNRFVYKEIIAEMTRRGFVYYDWNVSGEDAVEGATWTTIYNNVVKGAKAHIGDRVIILLHDSKSRTVTVTEDIITALEPLGYTFEPLTHNITPITFAYLS
jgi:peptidoglycan/xylan/chitin deacetylase (PgdA/CDA1 family)